LSQLATAEAVEKWSAELVEDIEDRVVQGAGSIAARICLMLDSDSVTYRTLTGAEWIRS
jgi:hypothetical protein